MAVVVLLVLAPAAHADEVSGATTPAPPAAAAAAAPATAEAATAAPSSVAAYLAGELRYGQRLIGFARPAAREVRALTAFQGAYEPQSLAGGALYQALGRPDLVEATHRRKVARYAMPIAGGAVALIGFVCMVASSSSITLDRGSSTNLLTVGGVALGLGAASLFGGMFVSPDPIGADEARALVEGYNRALRAQLGLPPLEVLRGAAPPLSITPMLGPSGGGVSLALRF